MKVSINTKNAPLPFVGAALSAGASLVGGVANATSNHVLQDKQMQHDKDMAAINQQYNQQNMAKQHKYNLASMEQQNQYQLDQWNRENEYNDPSAVAKRYRDAGINPRAAFGTGSASGAGVAGGFSGAPSGGAPSGSGSLGSPSTLPGGNQFAGLFSHLGADVNQALLNNANIRSINADAVGKEIDNQTKSLSNLLDIDLKIQELENKKAEKGLTEKEIEKIDADIAYLSDLSKKIKSDINVNEQNISESQSRQKLNNRTADKVAKETDIMEEQREAMLSGLVANEFLKGAQESYYLELANKVGKDIELIEKDLDNYDINLHARLAQMTSSELRGWASVLNEYLERRDNNSNAKMSNDEKKKQNRILLLRFVLPFLLK